MRELCVKSTESSIPNQYRTSPNENESWSRSRNHRAADAFYWIGGWLMLRLIAVGFTVVVVLFVMVDVCGVHPGDITASGLATRVRSMVVVVKR